MKRFPAFLTLVMLVGNLFAQQLLNAPFKLLPEQDINIKDIPNITFNKQVLCNRQSIIDDYNNVYLASAVNTPQLAWTGSTATCTAGTTSNLSKTNTLNRINYFRKLVGLSNMVVLDQNAYETNCQAAALIMDANANLSHSPPNTWLCWTQAGSNGAGSSNLALGAHSAGAIALFMYDPGSGNEPAGHRRWILHSRATKFGTGSTSSNSANALFVFGPSVIPPTLPSFIAYPCEGYFPRSLTPSRWSFGIPGANFSNAVVTVLNEAGAPVGITQHPYQVGYGDNTLTWEMPNTIYNFVNLEDAVYTVTVSGIGNAPSPSYTYQVVLISESTPTVAFSKTDPTCLDNGSVTAAYSAGALSYVWSNGQSTAALSNLLPGTYTVTVTDKVNCTTVATVNMLDNSSAMIAPGDAVPSTVFNCNGNIQLNLSTTGALNLKTNQIVGWWFTQDAPASNVATDQTSLNTALANAVVNPPSITPSLGSFLYKSTTGTSFQRAFNCGGQLDPAKTYYATPFVSENDSPAPVSYTNNTTSGNIVIKDFSGGFPGETEIPIKVWQTPSSANLKKVCVQLTYTGFSTLNDLSIKVVDPYGTEVFLTSFFPGIANGKGGINACYVDDQSGISVWDGCNGACYTGSINTEESFSTFDNIDPNGTWTLVVTDNFNTGFKPNYISANLEFDAAPYAIHFPDVDFSKCVLGNPVHFACSETNNPAPPNITGQTQYCGAVAGTLSAESGYQTYLWSSGQTTASISIQQPGTYTVTVSSASGCTSSSTVTVQLSNAPSVSITGNTTLCQGQSTSLNAGAGFSTYAWSSGQTTASINVQSSGSYTVTVSNAAGCSNSASVLVSVNSVATPNITGNLSFCPGGNSTLSAPVNYAGYQWSTNQTTASIQVQQAGTYTVTVMNAQGCTASNSVTVTTLSAPTVNISGILSFCPGGNTTLSATNGFPSYQWSTNQTSAGIQVQQAGTYQITVVNGQGCTASNSATVTTLPTPTVNISGAISFCEGSSTILNAGSGFTTYAWSNGLSTQNITVTGAGTYTVTVSNAQGCSGTASQSVTAHPKPLAVINGALSFCAGQTTVLSSNPGLSAYLWNTGATSPAIVVSTAGAYAVTVTTPFGCTDDAAANVSALPVPVVNLGPDKIIVQGQQTTLNASGPGLSYLWSTGATTASITVQAMGTYTVTVTDPEGCTGTDDIKVQVTSDATEPENAFKIELYPNPAQDYIQFRCQGLEVNSLILEDIQGRIMAKNHTNIPKDTWQKLDLSSLPTGTYFLILNGERQVSSIRFIKVK